MPPRLLPRSLTITARLTAEQFLKVDRLAKAINRTRTETMRELIKQAYLTGEADVGCRLVAVETEDTN